MSREFRKGQLVAVNSPAEDDRQWHLRVFKEKRADGHFVAVDDKGEYAWQLCFPAEEVWPSIFFGRERRAGEQAVDAVAMESELVQRLRRQIKWLCEELNQINSGSDEMCYCPDSELRFAPKPLDCHPEGCARCWEQASLKAAREEKRA